MPIVQATDATKEWVDGIKVVPIDIQEKKLQGACIRSHVL
jgi:hypothetical protein